MRSVELNLSNLNLLIHKLQTQRSVVDLNPLNSTVLQSESV